jgi:hypothetical protein
MASQVHREEKERMRPGMVFAAAVLLAATAAMKDAQARGGGRSGGYAGTGSNSSSHGVGGYTTRRGTYVAPHAATNPNSTQRDNYQAQGNFNPYSGAVGTRLVPR